MRKKIGITLSEASFQNYPAWIESGNESVDSIILERDNLNDLNLCGGLILSGGLDMHPRFYHNKRSDYPNRPNTFDESRDKFELEIFHLALAKNLPILAICRGLQLINVALGGSMIQDLEESGKKNHRKISGEDQIHSIGVVAGTLLHEITKVEIGEVNSAHHQSIYKPGNGLRINCNSEDGVPEGMEWEDAANRPFLLCVQWHPERLEKNGNTSAFSTKIREYFLKEVT